VQAGQLLEQISRGEPVEAADVAGLVRDWDSGAASEAQMGAWCMAAHIGGLDRAAICGVVRGLVAAGDRLELARVGPSAVAHSLGAVGDPSALIAAPIAASLGVRVPYLCTRGVEDVGGDVDRLEAIPGYRTTCTTAQFVRALRDAGVAAAEVDRLAPARGRLAVLRESVGLAASVPIATAATMAAAIASGAQGLVMVLPVGSGGLANRVDVGDAARLAAVIAEEWERELRIFSLPVEAPLGRVVGNGLEIAEAGRVLAGETESPLARLAITLAGAMAELAEVADPGEGEQAAEEALSEGHALATAERWVEAHGGSAAIWTEPGLIPEAPILEEVVAPVDGTLTSIDPGLLGAAARWLGAGRMHPSQAIDISVGVELVADAGDEVQAGEVVAHIHGRDPGLTERAALMTEQAITVDGASIATASRA
jgi:thymidine phosphorylase